jgi:NAD(P)-dependent dehydrogenase (short-subunit alcohol dehydrogenase family)
MQVKDKVVVVTGAARGLGRAYAERLAAGGAAVVVGDVRDCTETAAAVEKAGGRCTPVKLDVTSFDSCKAMAERAVAKYGRIDGLVNNAALFANIKGGRFDSLPEEQWDRVMAVNVKGIWNCCKAVVPEMRKAGGGSIVNISSLAAVYGLPYGLDYATSKAAVIGMTRSLARELGRDWIRVNAVGPSAVMTEGAAEYFGDKFEKAKQVIAQGQALQRNLEVEDLVGTIVYLVSDASRFVTGQTIMVDGGTVFL